MKPLYILANIPRSDYGKPELGNSFEYDTFYQYFVDEGHRVDLFDYTSVYHEVGQVELGKQLLAASQRKKYDLIFTVPFTHQFTSMTLDRLKKVHSGALSVAWMCDDKWRWERFSQHLAPHFDYTITTDPGAIAKYKSINYQGAILSQWAHNPKVYQRKKSSKKYDVSFIGGISAWRAYVIAYLQKQGVSVTAFGTGWPAGRVSVQEIVTIYNQSKIVLNLSNSTHFHLPYLLTFKPYKPQDNWKAAVAQMAPGLTDFLLSNKRTEDIKARFFEVTGTGAFLLSYPVEYLDHYLVPGKDLVCYNSLEDLSQKIRLYLADDQAREYIAHHGYQTSSTQHTYDQRFQALFKQIGLL